MSEENFSITNILEQDEEIKKLPELLEIITSVFDFTQYLLDDDENLTKSANLTSSAKEKLDQRIEELYLGENSSDEEVAE